MRTVVAKSWSDVQRLLYVGAWNRGLGRYRLSIAFRGLSDAQYVLETSLMRLGGDVEAIERHLLRNFRKYARRQIGPEDSTWNWLAVAQHYGLPTRLLDWTFSPFVALHFATSNRDRFKADGAVWCVNYENSNRFLPDELKGAREQERSNVFTVEMLSAVVRTDEGPRADLARFDGLGDKPFLVFIEPPSLDDRIVNQAALFSLMSSPTARLDDWLEDKPELGRKIIVPASLKQEIRDKLDDANVTERVLFPGLDGLSQWLKRYYGPRAASARGA